jgi:diguanylate cyclase (GGDEF)-like protein/PAS domain S-box-containing protein
MSDEGKVDGIFGISRDITEMREAQERQKLAATVFHHSREGIVITDATGTILEVNDAFTDITGFSREEVVGRNPSLLASGRHAAEFFTSMWQTLAKDLAWEGEVWNRRKGGEVYAELLNISAVSDDSGGVSHYVGMFMDITVRKDQEQRLERMAHYDPLTTLPNRLLFDDRLRQAMAQAKRRGQQLAVLFIDLDGFKAINDQHGHEAGDVLLVNIAYRLKETLRAGDSIARIGGDEFAAVLTDLVGFGDVELLVGRLLVAASAPVHHGGHAMQVSASIGIVMSGDDDRIGAEELVQHADHAMYEAKRKGKNRYAIYARAEN